MGLSVDQLASLRSRKVHPQARALAGLVEEACLALSSGKDARASLGSLLDLCAETFGATRVSLMARDPATGAVSIEAVNGRRDPGTATVRFGAGEGIAGEVAATGRIICLSDAASDARYVPGRNNAAGLRMLSVPVPASDGIAGVLTIERPPGAPEFSPGEVALARVVAAVAGPAVQEFRLRDELEQRGVDLATVQLIGNLLVSTLNGEELLENLVTYVGDVMSARACVLYTQDEKPDALRIRATYGDPPDGPRLILPGQGTIGRVAERRLPLLVRSTVEHPDFEPEFECFSQASSLVLAPLIAKGELLGIIVVADRRSGQPFSDPDLELLTLFAGQAAAALDNVRLYAQLERAATTDALTHLANRRSFEEVLEKEMVRSQRYGFPLSLLMLDLDHFKEVNDSFGHTAGDQVLRGLGELLSSQLRTTDVPARYGGEEFAIIMPHTPKAHAAAVADRLRKKVEETNLFAESRLRAVTVSIGVAAFPLDGAEMDTLVAAADNALYSAKRAGRNRVVTA